MTVAVQKANRYIEQKKGRIICGKCRTFLNVAAFSPRQTFVIPQNMGWQLRPEAYDWFTGIGEIPEHWVCPRCAELKDPRIAPVNRA